MQSARSLTPLMQVETIRVAAVIVARNEEAHIGRTLESLRRQTHPLEAVVFVDDGSLDETGVIAKEYGCTVIRLPPHPTNLRNCPALAERFNVGLRRVCNDLAVDYVLIMGADHPLPPSYVERVLSKMTKEERVVVASGAVAGELVHPDRPRGGGRLINAQFWRAVDDMQYEEVYSWETAFCQRVRQLGYENKCFTDIFSVVSRRTTKPDPFRYGKALIALGATLPAVIVTVRPWWTGPLYCAKVLFSWILSRTTVKRSKTAYSENLRQKQLMVQKIKRLLGRLVPWT